MAEIFTGGTLYLCPTPIGNLEDITYRTVRCLREATVIAAEDTRHTRKLLQAFSIEKPLLSYHEHNKTEKGPLLIERLRQGDMVALVSDAGMPAISDPGADLVRLALEAGIPIVPLPGANAGLTGLIASGLDTTRFTFIGFLPKTKKHRVPELEKLKNFTGTLIFYEAPHRIETVLAEIENVFGERQAVVCRELTKKYEQFIRGTLTEVRALLHEQGSRGEFVILIAAGEGELTEKLVENMPANYVALVAALCAGCMDKKEAIRTVAKRCGVAKRDVYQSTLRLNT
jgi:16S rRNA (cytidine1402-2'-O)-methyltransferase